MILKDLLTKLAPKLIKHVRSIAPSPRSVDVLIGCKDCPNVGNKPPPFVQEIVDKIFDSKQRHTLAIPIKQAMGLFIVQNILDVATCLRNPTGARISRPQAAYAFVMAGNGDTTLSMLRGFCLAFSPVLASHSPTVFTKSYETSANTCTNCTGAETSAPTALVLKFKKCGSISKEFCTFLLALYSFPSISNQSHLLFSVANMEDAERAWFFTSLCRTKAKQIGDISGSGGLLRAVRPWCRSSMSSQGCLEVQAVQVSQVFIYKLTLTSS